MEIRFAWLFTALAAVSMYGCGGGGDITPESVGSASSSEKEAAPADAPADYPTEDPQHINQRVTNGGFERGDYSGWKINIDWGISEFDPYNKPAGSIGVTTLGYDGIFPKGGTYALYACTGETWFLGNLHYDLSAKQRVLLDKGDTLRGHALFYNGDPAIQDSAWVKVLDEKGNKLLAVPWIEYSGGARPTDPNSIPFYSYTDWEPWNWTAPKAGIYTLMLGASTAGDNRFLSCGFFDAIRVVPANTEALQAPKRKSIQAPALVYRH